MKNIGTLRCKLFGHKFLTEKFGGYKAGTDIETWWKEITFFCTRCGIKREELT